MENEPKTQLVEKIQHARLEDGIRVIELTGFDEFVQYTVKTGKPVHGGLELLWRGQASSEWEMLSGLARTGQAASSHLHTFREATARVAQIEFDLDTSNPKHKENELHLWSLGQHHGLKTPLIDMTIYPYVALFFAFESANIVSPFRSVFCLDWFTIGILNFHITETNGMGPFRKQLENPPYAQEFRDYLVKRFGDDEIDHSIEKSQISKAIRTKMCAWEYAHLKEQQLNLHRSRAAKNKRIRAQGGWHVYTPKDVSVETWIRENRGEEKLVMTKLLIPNSERQQILNSLNQMNINYVSLFPDLEGAAKHSNLSLMESGWSGFRDY